MWNWFGMWKWKFFLWFQFNITPSPNQGWIQTNLKRNCVKWKVLDQFSNLQSKKAKCSITFSFQGADRQRSIYRANNMLPSLCTSLYNMRSGRKCNIYWSTFYLDFYLSVAKWGGKYFAWEREGRICCSLFVGREGERRSVHHYRTEGRTREVTRCRKPELK